MLKKEGLLIRESVNKNIQLLGSLIGTTWNRWIWTIVSKSKKQMMNGWE